MFNITVIIPIYNGEKYLKECLNSIFDQTLKNIEVICVNDGSTDNTYSILNEYSMKHENLKIINTKQKGQGHARNIALNIAKGEYIAFVDADDWIDSETLDLLYNKAKLDNLDLVFFQLINYIDNTKKFVETDLYNHICFENHGITENIVFNSENTTNFLFEIPVCPVSKLYKREFLENNNLKFPEGILFEDNAFFYNSYLKCKKAGFIKKQLYFRRRHDNSVTQTINYKKFDIVNAVNEIFIVFLYTCNYHTYKKDLINHTFSMLIEWFQKFPLNIQQEFYNYVRQNFVGYNNLKLDFQIYLKDSYKLIHQIMANNDFYLDFLSEYKLATSDYKIFDKGVEYELNSKEYRKYKSNEKNKFKLSIVIPIHNNEKVIHRTLMSIENQTIGISDIEVLMIDDCSSDNTYNIIKEYSNKYVGFKAIHIKQPTGSPGTPRNIGIIESSSKFIIFLDHDDLFEINALSILYDSIIKTDSDFVFGTYASVDNDVPTKIIFPNEKKGCFNNIFENERSIAFPPPSIWTKLFRREFLIDNRILFPTILGEDAIFISKALLKAEGICYLNDSLICYHILNKKSCTNNVSFKYLVEGFTSEDYLYNYYKINNNMNFYKIRLEGILDFYLNQFYKSNLSKKEIYDIFPLLYKFINRANDFGAIPHVSEMNKILFDNILNNNLEGILIIKDDSRKKPSKHAKLKNLFKKIKNKVL